MAWAAVIEKELRPGDLELHHLFRQQPHGVRVAHAVDQIVFGAEHPVERTYRTADLAHPKQVAVLAEPIELPRRGLGDVRHGVACGLGDVAERGPNELRTSLGHHVLVAQHATINRVALVALSHNLHRKLMDVDQVHAEKLADFEVAANGSSAWARLAPSRASTSLASIASSPLGTRSGSRWLMAAVMRCWEFKGDLRFITCHATSRRFL